MKQLFGLARVGLLAALAVGTSWGTITTYIGDAYGPGQTAETRATWSGQMGSLTYDDINFFAECVAPSCTPSYNSGSGPPATGTFNVAPLSTGLLLSGVTFTGSNSGSSPNPLGLYIRQLTGSRNSFYNGLAGNAGFPQWTSGLATVQGVVGAPSMTISLPTGTRSVGFDFGSITNLSNSNTANLQFTTTMAGGATSISNAGRYDVNQSSPSYLATGPGFFGITNDLNDILTITIVANASSSSWVLNIANFRAGVQIHQPTPEPSTQLALGSALILLSLLLRYRSKSTRGGNA